MRIVQHSLVLPASPTRLYRMYLDPLQHAAFTGGGEVAIAARIGAPFSAFGGRISGQILALSPDRQIVQSWRSFEWRSDDLDSILVLTFWPEPGGTRLDLVQTPAPEHLYATLQANWPMRYLEPWRNALVTPE